MLRWGLVIASGVLVFVAYLLVAGGEAESGPAAEPRSAEPDAPALEPVLTPAPSGDDRAPTPVGEDTRKPAAPAADREPPRSARAVRPRLAEVLKGEDPSTWPRLPSRYIREAMREEFVPLLEDCACRLHPDERRHLAVKLRFFSTPDLGGAVESVEPSRSNEIEEDGGLMECVRESAYSLSLPATERRGSTVVTLQADGCPEEHRRPE